MGIREFLERLKAKKQKYKEYDEEMRMQELYEEKQMSANERELRRFMKEKREDDIKKELEEWRNAKRKDVEFGHQITKTKNMFDPRLNQKSIMAGKNMFTGGKNLFASQKCMFIK